MLKKSVDKKKIAKTGAIQDIWDAELCDRIRKRLGIKKKKDLKDTDIRQILIMSNKLIAEWLLENPEGFMLEVGYGSKKPMGVLSVSKHLPKEFRDTKEESVEHIQTIKVSDGFRKTLMKRYNVEVDRTLDYHALVTLKEKVPQINLNTFFYKYRYMWFNKRNCTSRKAFVYHFKANVENRKGLAKKIFGGKDYFEWNFNDFYFYKVKSKF